ncbi:iron(III) ABC transporter, periplasmic iron-binding protein [Chloroherpeton thalassium ATCC 35110]|uniref:Iron(III) ABC transporter, periplasmic iron-binding protein n=1 Tax=Chloroherpeton thalassium (strain ATCC 35110 / GB-78) TaxID=517418 RepID=B3QW31_CHLT3|nr:ABC transporter substrate-binding protein [Chloroherpeton thalassium]ACF14685.1 iron(III) ABC transporter, periplasmic iron-binding protein [Chloroherpeton thalassium ATCC 35110]
MKAKTHIPQSGVKCAFFFFGKARILFLLSLLYLLLLCNACSKPSADKAHQAAQKPSADLAIFTKPLSEIKYAKGFDIHYENGVKLIRIFKGFQDKADTLRYVLAPKNFTVPEQYRSWTVVRTPIERAAIFTTTHAGFFSLLGAEENIVGMATPEFINSPKIKSRIDAGEISEIGDAFSPNLEVMLACQLDVVLVTVLPTTKFSQYQTLIESGSPVVVIGEWLENSPLGRAEWMKLLAALLDKESLANEEFAQIESAYQSFAKLTDSVSVRPSVLTGLAYKDSWFVPAGESYGACLLKDAGASYHWSSKKGTGSLNLDFEAVYPVALAADFWINPGTLTSMKELFAKDSRFKDFSSVRSGRVFNNNKQLNANGGNAYWEYGIVKPHLVLGDLISIFHPELKEQLPSDVQETTFYQQVK